MRQPTPNLPITAKMLRHFAIVTVAITACIGVFAQGENSEVAPSPAKGAPQEAEGSMMDFGGAERRALAGGNKNTREVNGMKLASGTRLESGGDGGGGDSGGSGGSGEGSGSIQSPPPMMRGPSRDYAGAAPEAVALAEPAAPPPIPKDSNGVPAPGAAISASNPASSGKPQPPRKATQQDIERMMAASTLRSGRATTD